MLESLNRMLAPEERTLCRVSERPEGETGMCLTLLEKRPRWLKTRKAIYITPCMGMTAVCVVPTLQEKPSHAYYLDQTLRVEEQTLVGLFALRGRCGVDILLTGEAPELLNESPCEPPGLYLEPSLRVSRIYTLFYQERKKGFLFPGERHEPYELTYVDRGRMTVVSDGQSFVLGPKDALLCTPNQWHLQYAQPEEAVAFLTVSFDVESGGEELVNQIYPSNASIAECFSQLLEARETVDDLAVQALERALVHMREGKTEQRRELKVPIPARGNDHDMLNLALQYIQSHIHQPLTVAGVSKGVNVSVSYLSLLFRKQLQMTPLQYIHKLKMEEARGLLHQGELSITEISHHLGFKTIQHFSRCFRDYFGFSPREYAHSLH